MVLRLKDILNVEPLNRAEIMSGEDNLENKLTGVTIMEAPDIEKSLYGGELVLTSLFPVQDNNYETYQKLIHNLKDKKISALAIKTNRIHEIPEVIIKTGKEVNLPIIKLPSDIKYIDIIYPTMSKLINSQYLELKYFKDLHNDFIEASFSENSLKNIANTLDDKINNPIIILDSNEKVICESRKLNKYEIDDIEEYYSESESINLKNSIRTYYKPVIFKDKTTKEQKKIPKLQIPIIISDHKIGSIIIYEMESNLNKLNSIAIEQAVTFVSLEMYKRSAISEVIKRFKNDLLNQILTNNFSSKEYILNKANQLDWDLNQAFTVCLIRIENTNSNINLKNYIFKLNQIVDSISHSISNSAIIGERNNDIVILLPGDRSSDKDISTKEILQKIIDNKFFEKLRKSDFILGYGTKAFTLEEISQSYYEAYETVTVGEILKKYNDILGFNNIGIYRFISKLKENNIKMDNLIPDSLKKLIEYDSKHQSELIKTLKTFFHCNNNAKNAAKNLHIHYKTMLYRLERIKEIGSLDFNNYEEKLEIQVGLEVLELINY